MTAMRKILVLQLIFVSLACDEPTIPAEPASADLKVEIRTLDGLGQESLVFTQSEAITIELSITNLASDEKTLMSPSTNTTVFKLKNEGGDVVWDTEGAVAGAMFTNIVIGANDTHTAIYSWHQEIDRDGNTTAIGDYILEGSFIGARGNVATTNISIE